VIARGRIDDSIGSSSLLSRRYLLEVTALSGNNRIGGETLRLPSLSETPARSPVCAGSRSGRYPPTAVARCDLNTSMQRYLAGEADDIRQRRRDEILGASVADFRAFADALADLTAYGQVVVLGSEQAIQAANARRSGFLHVAEVV